MEGQLQKFYSSLCVSFEQFQKSWKEFWSEDWYLSLNKPQTVSVALLILLLAVGSGILFFKRQPGKTVIKEIVSKPPGKSSNDAPKVKKSVVVHVCGAVASPGVYELSAEERVNDAIAQAGGGKPEANIDALNLAAKLVDGQRIYVPKVGEAAPATLALPDASLSSGFPINLNTATLEQLDTLPGIGETLAKRIIEHREAQGGFKKVSELQNIEGIGEKKYNQIKDKVAVD